MPTTKQVRRSVTVPAQIAQPVERLAKRRRLSDNRVLVELVEQGIEGHQAQGANVFRARRTLPLLKRPGRGQETRRPVGPLRFRGIMPQIENWSRLPPAFAITCSTGCATARSVSMISTYFASGSSRSRMSPRDCGTRISRPSNFAGKESVRKPSYGRPSRRGTKALKLSRFRTPSPPR